MIAEEYSKLELKVIFRIIRYKTKEHKLQIQQLESTLVEASKVILELEKQYNDFSDMMMSR